MRSATRRVSPTYIKMYILMFLCNTKLFTTYRSLALNNESILKFNVISRAQLMIQISVVYFVILNRVIGATISIINITISIISISNNNQSNRSKQEHWQSLIDLVEATVKTKMNHLVVIATVNYGNGLLANNPLIKGLQVLK